MPSTVREHTVTRTVFVISILVTVVLYALPELYFVAFPLRLLATLVHEMGHGLAAVLVGGSFVSFEMFSDGSGVAHTATTSQSRLAAAFVAAGGLIGPAIAAAASFVVGRKPEYARAFLTVLCVGALASLVFVVRNTFGWIFVGSFALLLAVLVLKASARASQAVLVFLGTQLGLSIFAQSDYLFTRTAETVGGPMPSDVAVMSQALLLPYWFWGLACGTLSILALALGARTLWKS